MSKHDKRIDRAESAHGNACKRKVIIHKYAPGAVPPGVILHPPEPEIGEHDEVLTVVHTFWSPLSSPPYSYDPTVPGAFLEPPLYHPSGPVPIVPGAAKR